MIKLVYTMSEASSPLCRFESYGHRTTSPYLFLIQPRPAHVTNFAKRDLASWLFEPKSQSKFNPICWAGTSILTLQVPLLAFQKQLRAALFYLQDIAILEHPQNERGETFTNRHFAGRHTSPY